MPEMNPRTGGSVRAPHLHDPETDHIARRVRREHQLPDGAILTIRHIYTTPQAWAGSAESRDAAWVATPFGHLLHAYRIDG